MNSSNDAKGLAFQKFLSHREKELNGQFFTPEPIIELCINFIQPEPDKTIVDPACGSGGFLFSYIRFLKNKFPKLDIKNYISNNLFGMDLNKSIARIAKMKLLLESNVSTNIYCYNSLEENELLYLVTKQKTGFDIVLTNPPFGAKISHPKLLSNYNLGFKWNNKDGFKKTNSMLMTQSAEILFIERCLQLLKDGGKMGIVLPNGNFENPSLEYLRYYIKTKAKILAVVKLPQETFIPYGTGVKTSVLFLEKRENANNYKIFFGKVRKLGYQGNKSATPIYKKDSFGNVLKSANEDAILDEDLSLIIQQYNKFLVGGSLDKDNSFSIHVTELNGRLDFDFYSPKNRQLVAKLLKLNSIKLGDACEIQKQKSKKLKHKNQLVEYIELSDVNAFSFEIINSTTYFTHELPSRASYELKTGDIVTAIAGNSIGSQKHATAFVTDEYQDAICSNGFRVLRNFKIDPFYLLYYLKTEFFLRQMFMYRTGAAIPIVSDLDLQNILICLPSKGIQKEISLKIKKFFELRQKSKKEIDNIELILD